MHRAHGAKQQRRDQQQKHQVGEVLDRRLANPLPLARQKAQADEDEDWRQ